MERYRHFKGNEYLVHGMVVAFPRDLTENDEELIVLKAKYSEDPTKLFPIYTFSGKYFINEDREMVLYQQQYGDYSWWVRPYKDFHGIKEKEDGTKVKRFQKVDLIQPKINII